MSEIVKFLLKGHKLMPEMHLTLLTFTYSVCLPLTRNREYKN